VGAVGSVASGEVQRSVLRKGEVGDEAVEARGPHFFEFEWKGFGDAVQRELESTFFVVKVAPYEVFCKPCVGSIECNRAQFCAGGVLQGEAAGCGIEEEYAGWMRRYAARADSLAGSKQLFGDG